MKGFHRRVFKRRQTQSSLSLRLWLPAAAAAGYMLTQYYFWLRDQPAPSEAVAELQSLFAQEPHKLETSASRLGKYEESEWTKAEGVTPLAAVYPETHEDVAATMKVCNQFRVSVFPFGAGTGLRGDTQLTLSGVVLDMSRMKGVEVAPDDSMCTVQPGVTWEELNQILAQHGQWLPHSAGPMATLGGMASTNAVGLYSLRYGAFKSAVVGVKAVLASGSSLKSRGVAPKTYPGLNLNEVLLGSEGTLGVITELTLKTYRLPDARSTGVLQTHSPIEALNFAQKTPTFQSAIVAVDVIAEGSARCLNRVDPVIPEQPCVLIKLHGSKEEVTRQKSLIQAQVVPKITWHDDLAVITRIDDLQRQLPINLMKETQIFPRTVDIVVPLSKLEGFYTKALEDIREEGLSCATSLQTACGIVKILCCEDPSDLSRQHKLERTANRWMSKAVLAGGNGTATLSVGTELTYFLAVDVGANSVQTQQKLKDIFDPHRILSPGKVLEDLRPRNFREYLAMKLRRLIS